MLQKRLLGASLLLLLSPCLTYADVKPHALFSSNMVLQRGMALPVWGTADSGEKVTVQLEVQTKDGKKQDKQTVTTGTDGKWMVKLNAFEEGTNGVLTISGNNTVELNHVLIGDVWVCSGQSNMQWSILQSDKPEERIKDSKNDNLRLFYVTRTARPEPQSGFGKPQPKRDFENQWQVCGPETVGEFSAVAYHFGNALQKALNVPVGLIHTSWGGTPAEAWTSKESLLAEPELKYYVENLEKSKAAYDPEKAKAQYESALEKWKAATEKAKEEKKNPPNRPQPPLAPGFSPFNSSSLYNAMIAPLLPFPIKGAIWYQGESNAGKAYEYRTLFTTMIQDWRKAWGYDLPFFCVQLAPFASGNENGVAWPELREAQLYATTKLPKVGMAVITDVGNKTDIHPKQKQPVGERLALAARAIAYGEKIVYSGPLYKSIKIDGNKAILSFDHVGGGLVAQGEKLTGFTMCGEDKKFHPAEAIIQGDQVIVSSDMVEKPIAVRYGWANYPVVNFFNKEGIPATPFRTDDFPYTTMTKKK
jgi:sialate O-acetylesterase